MTERIMEDTIAAIATPPGNGGVSIVRLSGNDAEKVLMKVFRPVAKDVLPLQSHMLTYGFVSDRGERVDECMAVMMRAPRSYTREDVAELQLHGGSYHVNRVLQLCLQAGARLAEPGEFTRRAFMNGRIDLSQAEAVMSLISARGEQAHQAAIRQLEGGTADFVRKAADELYSIQAGIAACVDYPEEITEEEATAELIPKTEKLIRTLEEACNERASRLIRDGLQVALYGKPNVGKSSLLNALLGEERAIVTNIPGTTRDTVTGELQLGGVNIHLTDTAGLRETADPVEKLGVERSEKALTVSDTAVLILDGSRLPDTEDYELMKRLPENGAVIINKSDLEQKIRTEDLQEKASGRRVFECSALEPDTLKPFKEWLRTFGEVTDQLTLTQPRHLDAVRRAIAHLKDALETVRTATVDLAATDLQAAQASLSEITGDQADEKLLDTVFSTFCVGK